MCWFYKKQLLSGILSLWTVFGWCYTTQELHDLYGISVNHKMKTITLPNGASVSNNKNNKGRVAIYNLLTGEWKHLDAVMTGHIYYLSVEGSAYRIDFMLPTEVVNTALPQPLGVFLPPQAITSVSEQVSRLEQNNQQLFAHNSQLQKLLAESNLKYNLLLAQWQAQLYHFDETQKKTIQKECDEKKRQINKLREEISALQQEVDSSRARINQLEQDAKSSGNQVKEIEQKRQAAQNESILKNQQLSDKDSQIKYYEQKNKKLNEQIAELNQREQEFQSRLDDNTRLLTQQRANEKKQIEELILFKKNIAGLNETIKQLKGKIKDKNKQNSEQEKKL